MRYCDRAVFLPDSQCLVIADLHLGRGRDKTVSYAVDSFQEDTKRLTTLLETYTPDAVVIAGDILHAFSAVPEIVTEQLSELERVIHDAETDLIYVRGNHDTVLDRLTEIPLTKTYRPRSTDILITHGHELPNTTAGTVIIGHEHPALTIEGHKYPCFLKGPGTAEIGTVVILPSFSTLPLGTAVNASSHSSADSPIVTDLEEFTPIVYTPDTDEIFEFPPLSVLTSEFPP